MIDRRPAAVVRVANAGDVMAVVDHARENDLALAIRGGGHSGPGFGTNDGGLVIDFSGLRGVRVDRTGQDRPSGGRRHLGRLQRGDSRLRPGYHRRDHLDDRDRRADPGRRDRLSLARFRTLARQPGVGRCGDRRREVPRRQREGEPRSLLGPPRWRRELRRVHLARVPAPSGARRLLGPDVLRDRGGRERPSLLPGVHQGCPGRDGGLPCVPDRSAAAVHPARIGTATCSWRSWRAGPARSRRARPSSAPSTRSPR